MEIELPFWYDLHVHLRQDDLLKPLIKAQLSMACAGVLAMPNTAPPITTLRDIEKYKNEILSCGGDGFDEIIIPLYLTAKTAPKTASQARAAKYYPPHGTTGAGAAADIDTYIENGVFAAMQSSGTILCIHGEAHDLSDADYFSRSTNAEEEFYKAQAPRIIEKFPNLKIVCEHITTKVAADFVKNGGENVGATITPQHLLYTIGHLLRGLKYHLHCMPVVKFEQDRQALLKLAATHPRTFAGTDSAPHAKKATECGCAAGCFTAGYAPQLYAMAFEELSSLNKLKDFLCTRGAQFYGLRIPNKTFTLVRKTSKPLPISVPQGKIVPLPLGMCMKEIPWTI